MAYMLLHLEVDDYDTWKRMFDDDPAGRRKIAKGHMVSQAVDHPNEVFIRAEFASVDDAKTFRKQLLDSGVLNNATVKTPPTVVEVVDEATY
jgi:hypothetical protein